MDFGDLKANLKEFYKYAKKQLNLSSNPTIILKKDTKNANDFLGKTGGYDPKNKVIYLYVSDRHPKDVVRSLSHELVHHSQNLNGLTDKVDISKIYGDESYAQNDEGLREMERDAFERGNMIFRDWTDFKKAERENTMSEKKLPKKVVTKAHKIAKKIAKAGGVEEPYAVGMAAAKKQAGIKEQEVEVVETLQESKEKEQPQKAPEPKVEEKVSHPYPQLFQEKERLLGDAFNKKEEIIYQELVRRFLKK